tara:strand:- start:1230 stop:1466 length:237 start_codon:yes stop_codon:yes gene_type:complete
MSFNLTEYIDKLIDNYYIKYTKFKNDENDVYVVPEIPNLVTDGFEVFGIINLHNYHEKSNKHVTWNPNIYIEYNYPVP